MTKDKAINIAIKWCERNDVPYLIIWNRIQGYACVRAISYKPSLGSIELIKYPENYNFSLAGWE